MESFRGAVAGERTEVRRGAIPLVARETIGGIPRVEPHHRTVARNLRDDGGELDLGNPFVAARERPNRPRREGAWGMKGKPAIEEHHAPARCDPAPFHEPHVGARCREVRRATDIHPIYEASRNPCGRKRECSASGPPHEAREPFLPGPGGKAL